MLERKLISNVEFEDINHKDAPDYCDAHVVAFEYDGVPATEEQLEELGDDADMVYELLMDYLY